MYVRKGSDHRQPPDTGDCGVRLPVLIQRCPMKRKADVDSEKTLEPISNRRRTDERAPLPEGCLRLSFPSSVSRQLPAFQYPNQLISFSYTPERELVFDDSAMRYYCVPPLNSDLGFAYDAWIKRPEERGRLDGLLTACLREEVTPERTRANVITWRGIMTKCVPSL